MKIRLKDCACDPVQPVAVSPVAVQHVAVMAEDSVEAGQSEVTTTPGPISIFPVTTEVFAEAVRAGGGSVVPLGDETRGIIWLSNTQAAELSDVLIAHPEISWVQLPFAGVDAFSEVIATHASSTRVFTSAKGAYAQPVAEHALGLILAVLRFLPRRARATSWDAEPRGNSLYGKNVTIIGAGGIARELMRLLAPFGVKITIVRRKALPVPGAAVTVTAEQFTEVLPTTDVLVVAAALTPSSRHLIGSRELALLPPEAAVVNIARGALIDAEALSIALEAGALLGAAVDVTDPEPLPDGHVLWSAPNLLITPHMADTPAMTAPLLAVRIQANVSAFLSGAALVGIVERNSGY